jgi:hypothetical protein
MLSSKADSLKDFPSWLKSAQNGSIGEARTKAFLMDRFWVLDRSVDIESADFLVQRRITGKHILDENAPRFGVVQAKFSQDEKTVHRITYQDILDKDHNPHLEFFLIIHTGDEEGQRMFFLTAKDIAEEFPLNNDKYEVSSRAVFASHRYIVANRTNCLDRMENSIQCAEFYKNRAFVFSRLDASSNPDFEAILPDYKEKIDHYWQEDIPAKFKELKIEAFDAMLHIEKVYALLKSFVESVDPLEAIVIAETLNHRAGRSISLPEIFVRDFYYASKNFKEMIQNLRADGLLDNYISVRKDLIDAINSFLQSHPTDQLSKNSIHEILVEYDPLKLRFIRTTNKIWTSKEPPYNDFSKFLEAKEGQIVLSWKIGLQFIHGARIRMNDCCIRDIMTKIYGLKYYEGEEIGMTGDRT